MGGIMSKSADHAAEALQAILAAISRDDLIGELLSREGVAGHAVTKEESYRIQKSDEDVTRILEKSQGPVTIITVDGES
jgi:hypothetical protein